MHGISIKMLGSMATTTMLATVLAVGLLAGGTATPSPASDEAVEQASPRGIEINGHYVNRVLLNGKMMSLPEYGLLEDRANETGS